MDTVMSFPVRCVAYPHEDRWVAFCLDFDIALEAASFEDALHVMAEAVTTYVEDAMAEGEPLRSALLNRRAPWHVRLLWAWRIFRATLRSRERDAIEFPVPCPA